MPGATVVVNPAPDGEEGEVRLTIVKPKKQKTPVGVGAEGGDHDQLPVGEDEHSDDDHPAES
jgi:ATP-dependent Clp protease ATP-binding subunit ClpC